MLPDKNKKTITKPKFKDWFSQYFKAVVILAVIIILAAAYFFLLGPLYKQIKANGQASLDGKQRNLKDLQQYLADLQKLKDNFDNLSGSEKENLTHLNLVLPAESDLPGLFVQMDRIAANNGFALGNIDIAEEGGAAPAEPAAAGGLNNQIRKLNISISLLNGSYEDFLNFLDDIEYNLRLMDVKAVAFSGSEKSNFVVNLTTYYLAE